MSEDQTITIEINGRQLQANAGEMLIDAADAAGIDIPRFCYHKKLSVSANCRMCLVEVERAPKPLPACATPVADGMKVFTSSPLALAAQKGTMEFLLINHPLDCPICDQGGECELQDVAMGYGSDVSRFAEGKRAVDKPDIGPLVNANFTRCIHCTRCVRFGAEIAGVREMGAVGRSEHMVIGTYVEKSVDSELSGNIIDVCPVGSLTSKPYRFQARAWELIQRDTVSPHDAVGSNLHLHIRRNQVMRVVPKENEAVNECWISDRDRFSYEGLYSDDRLTTPLIKRDGAWREAGWTEALEAAAKGLKQSGSELGALISPTATVEEMQLARKLVHGLGSESIDYRLRQGDFRGQEPACRWLGQSIEALEQLDAALVIGGNVRKEQPLLGHRLRKAVLEGCKVTYINPLEIDLNYVAEQRVSSPAAMVDQLAALAKALGASGGVIDSATVGDEHNALAEQLKAAGKVTILLGSMATAHADFSILSDLAAKVAEASGATLGYLPEASNSTGAALIGMVSGSGKDAQAMLDEPGRVICCLVSNRPMILPIPARHQRHLMMQHLSLHSAHFVVQALRLRQMLFCQWQLSPRPLVPISMQRAGGNPSQVQSTRKGIPARAGKFCGYSVTSLILKVLIRTAPAMCWKRRKRLQVTGSPTTQPLQVVLARENTPPVHSRVLAMSHSMQWIHWCAVPLRCKRRLMPSARLSTSIVPRRPRPDSVRQRPPLWFRTRVAQSYRLLSIPAYRMVVSGFPQRWRVQKHWVVSLVK